jgi:hypothetical protein
MDGMGECLVRAMPVPAGPFVPVTNVSANISLDSTVSPAVLEMFCYCLLQMSVHLYGIVHGHLEITNKLPAEHNNEYIYRQRSDHVQGNQFT